MIRNRAGKAMWQRLRMAAGVFALVLPAALLQTVPAQATTVGCGDVLTSSVTLAADLTCTGPGPTTLTVNAANITIDLAGHTLSAGLVDDGFPGVTVKDGRLAGLSAHHSAAVTLSNVRVTQVTIKTLAAVTANGTPDTCEMGSIFVNLGHLTVDNCTLHGGTFFSGRQPTVRSSILRNGRLNFVESFNGLFTGNVFDNVPVALNYDSGNFTFRDNVFKNADTAIEANSVWALAGPTTIEYNAFDDNSIGMRAAPKFDGLIVRNNTFSRNRTVGLYIDNQQVPGQLHPVSDNVFLNNGLAPSGATDRWHNPLRGGLHLLNVSNTDDPPYPPITLSRNTGSGNADYVIWAVAGHVSDGGGNQGPCRPTGYSLPCS
ncbi:right-handed parallel beta-helix repeat-containing protein [Streptosporangium sp. NPDC001559]|uniref:right-handed parallel beta-helix repeat-containing protein n=1 Tax=Streptosporangium sp. NPDC001559 TaxID=3366187 RepID=UPI0036E575E0